MRLSATLLPALVGAASAASEAANVYLFSADSSPSSNPPTLTPEQARLVFAQRLGVSQYHGLGDASDSTLSYINQFGGRREDSLFGEPTLDQAAELVLVVEGVSGKSAGPLLNVWELIKPAFTISNPPSKSANKKLVLDLNQQSGEGQNCALEDAINPYEAKCWSGKSKVIHFDLAVKVTKNDTWVVDYSETDENQGTKIEQLMAAQKRLIQWAKKEEMNTIVVLMPESARSSKASSKPYGSYETPSQARLGARQAEEIMSVSHSAAACMLILFKATNLPFIRYNY
jgi:hypothetical protein